MPTPPRAKLTPKPNLNSQGVNKILSPPDTIRHRFARGWEYLRSGYLGLVDEWSIYDASQAPASLIGTGTTATANGQGDEWTGGQVSGLERKWGESGRIADTHQIALAPGGRECSASLRRPTAAES